MKSYFAAWSGIRGGKEGKRKKDFERDGCGLPNATP